MMMMMIIIIDDNDGDDDDDDVGVRMDHDAEDMETICYSLKCRAQGRRGYYRAGPALEGTPCGTNKVITGSRPTSHFTPLTLLLHCFF